MSDRGVFLCADIGTSSIKAALIAPDGRRLAGVRIPYEPSADETVQATVWETAFYQACERLFLKTQPAAILAIAISGNGPTFVPLDNNSQALAPLHWYTEVAPKWRELGGPSLFLPAVSQFFDQRREDASRTRLLVSAQEWLTLRLGAEPFTCLPNQDYTPWYWTDAELEARGLSATLFPPFVSPGTIVGELSESARSACGIPDSPERIPLVASGPDFFMAILGTACVQPGLACDRAGSSEGINYCADRQGPASKDLRTLPHWTKGLYNVSALLPPTGKRFEEFRRSSGQENRRYRDILADIDAQGSCTGPVCNPLASAGRAFVEGLGYTVREGLNRLESAGFPVSVLRLSGGQARNEIWNQLKADILGIPLVAGAILDAELAGNAALCLLASGEADSPVRAAQGIWREERVWEPDPVRARYYRDR